MPPKKGKKQEEDIESVASEQSAAMEDTKKGKGGKANKKAGKGKGKQVDDEEDEPIPVPAAPAAEGKGKKGKVILMNTAVEELKYFLKFKGTKFNDVCFLIAEREEQRWG